MPRATLTPSPSLIVIFDIDRGGRLKTTKDGQYRFSVTFIVNGGGAFRIPGWRIDRSFTRVTVPISYVNGTQYLNVIATPDGIEAVLAVAKKAAEKYPNV